MGYRTYVELLASITCVAAVVVNAGHVAGALAFAGAVFAFSVGYATCRRP